MKSKVKTVSSQLIKFKKKSDKNPHHNNKNNFG